MKTKDLSIDEMVVFFQSSSVAELKEVESNNSFLFHNEEEMPFVEEPEMDSMADYFQNLSLQDLKNTPTTALLLPQLSLDEKAAITGLKKSVILKLETHKEDATLGEIMTYCNKLEIPYIQFIPEFYLNFAK